MIGTATDGEILNVSPEEYHSRDEFSASLAKTVIAKSPLHARTESELGGKDPTKAMDRGNVIHRLVLGKGKDYQALDFKDFRTNAAKEARDAARAAGLVPILADDLADAEKAAERILLELRRRRIVLDGESELAVAWTEHTEHGPVRCRGMFDHAKLAAGALYDLKVTENASPFSVERTAESLGYAIQAAAYRRAVGALDATLLGRADFLFIFAEPEPPFAMNVCRPDGAFREVGERRWLRAVAEWAKCRATGQFPAYGDDINRISPPHWALRGDDVAA